MASSGLERALAEMEAGEPTEASVRAGLHHARRLATSSPKYAHQDARHALWRAMNDEPCPPWLVGESAESDLETGNPETDA